MPLKYTQIIILAVVFSLQYFFEHLYPQKKELNDWKNERVNLGIGVINVALNFVPASALVYWLTFIDKHNLGLFQQWQMPFWASVIITIFFFDGWMYAWHRMNHTIPLLWKFHRFHHTDEKMNSTTAVRFHFMELFFSALGKAFVYFIFGFTFEPLIIYEILFFTSVVIHHSNIRISARQDKMYRILFSSPVMHRIHHSKRTEELHSNYGSVFSFWDRVFNSWRGKPQGEISFGVADES